MTWIGTHYKLMAISLLCVACAVGLFRNPIEENILALVPKSIKKQVELFEHSPLSQKLIVMVQGPSEEQTNRAAQTVREKLTQSGLVRVFSPQQNLTEMLRALPARFTARDQQQAEQKLEPQAVAAQFEKYQEQLFSFSGIFFQQLITHDPFNLAPLLFDKWAQLGEQTQTHYQDGFLSSAGGTLQAGLYDLTVPTADFSTAIRVQQELARLAQELAQNVRVFFMGGLRYTLENVQLIKRDLVWLSLAGLCCLGLIFAWFFRSKRALLVYALPLLVLFPAAFITQQIFGRISGITLGFGSVVAGLSVDYAVYVYFATASLHLPGAKRALYYHLGCNFLTSALCFAALLFSSVEVFKQIAVFALVALVLSFMIACFVFPPYFKKDPLQTPAHMVHFFKPFSFRLACLTSMILVGFGIWGMFHLSFNAQLDSLNSTSAQFRRDKQLTNQLFDTGTHALLFVLGKTPQEVLESNEQLSRALPRPLATADLFVSARTQAQNKQRWVSFWNETRRAYAKNLLQQQSAKLGFNAAAFAPFWKELDNAAEQDEVDFSSWYNPLILLRDGSYALVNVVPDEKIYEEISFRFPAQFVSVSQLQYRLTHSIKHEALWVVCLALLFNFIAVWLVFRRLPETLLCFVPVVLGACALVGVLALVRLPVNLFGLIFLPLLVGLGIDYAIFQLMKLRAGKSGLAPLYPPQALLAAGLSTLAGFGVLILAKHAVLFMMGFCALVGIGAAVLIAMFVLPPLWERFI